MSSCSCISRCCGSSHMPPLFLRPSVPELEVSVPVLLCFDGFAFSLERRSVSALLRSLRLLRSRDDFFRSRSRSRRRSRSWCRSRSRFSRSSRKKHMTHTIYFPSSILDFDDFDSYSSLDCFECLVGDWWLVERGGDVFTVTIWSVSGGSTYSGCSFWGGKQYSGSQFDTTVCSRRYAGGRGNSGWTHNRYQIVNVKVTYVFDRRRNNFCQWLWAGFQLAALVKFQLFVVLSSCSKAWM